MAKLRKDLTAARRADALAKSLARRDLLRGYLPPRLHGFSIRNGSRGWITITIDAEWQHDPNLLYWKGIVEGLLLGRNMASAYLTDIGPQDSYSPCVSWANK